MTGEPQPQRQGGLAKMPPLRRTLGAFRLTLYGLGTILGAGIYVLTGEVAGAAGMAAPLAFLAASVVAGFTALSYAELASRIPLSAGEAAFVEHGLQNRWLAACSGWGIAFTGILSAAAITNGFHGYLTQLLPISRIPTITVVVLLMTLVASRGVNMAVGAAVFVTLLEIAGLGLVILLAGHHLSALPDRWTELLPPPEWSSLGGILIGAHIAFFAFIGFEDIVNMAEEVRQPSRNLPRAILLSIGISTLLYFLITTIAVLAVPPDQLAGSSAPFAMILADRGPSVHAMISIISMVAVINGALIQIVMTSRLLYGMANQRLAPRLLRSVHGRTRTPIKATFAAGTTILLLALALPLLSLAKFASTVTLFVFALVNFSLLVLRRREATSPPGKKSNHLTCPPWIPLVGFLLCIIFLTLSFWLSF